MNILKKLMVGVMVAAPLFLSGCSKSDETHQFEVGQVGEDILNEYLEKKYASTSLDIINDGGYSGTLYFMSGALSLDIKTNCISQLDIGKKQILVEKVFHQTLYKIKEGEVVDTEPFFRCVDKQLETTSIEDHLLYAIIVSNEYKNSRENPEFDKLVNQIKSDQVVTLHEGALILSYLHTQQRNKKLANIERAIKNL